LRNTPFLDLWSRTLHTCPTPVNFGETSRIIIDVTRAYTLKRRAERQEETRQRIVEAAIELHQTIGPAATTISQIAEQAGVGRVTVYRHFPDELTLARACSGQYFARNPAPDPDRWREIDDPAERLRTGLEETYAYHRATEAMMTHVLADARDHPVMAPYHAHWRRAADALVEPWSARGRRRTLLRSGIALALSFDTWRTLVRDQGLTDRQAVELVLRMTCECPDDPHAWTTEPRRRG
jgi:AcrR family transcriptional regulator